MSRFIVKEDNNSSSQIEVTYDQPVVPEFEKSKQRHSEHDSLLLEEQSPNRRQKVKNAQSKQIEQSAPEVEIPNKKKMIKKRVKVRKPIPIPVQVPVQPVEKHKPASDEIYHKPLRTSTPKPQTVQQEPNRSQKRSKNKAEFLISPQQQQPLLRPRSPSIFQLDTSKLYEEQLKQQQLQHENQMNALKQQMENLKNQIADGQQKQVLQLQNEVAALRADLQKEKQLKQLSENQHLLSQKLLESTLKSKSDDEDRKAKGNEIISEIQQKIQQYSEPHESEKHSKSSELDASVAIHTISVKQHRLKLTPEQQRQKSLKQDIDSMRERIRKDEQKIQLNRSRNEEKRERDEKDSLVEKLKEATKQLNGDFDANDLKTLPKEQLEELIQKCVPQKTEDKVLQKQIDDLKDLILVVTQNQQKGNADQLEFVQKMIQQSNQELQQLLQKQRPTFHQHCMQLQEQYSEKPLSDDANVLMRMMVHKPAQISIGTAMRFLNADLQ